LGGGGIPSGRVAVVGGGIIGLAHAWMAAEHGWAVTLFERDSRARGATVRNFGMVWPIGQPAGRPLEVALASRRRWLQLADVCGDVRCCGSLHVAHHSDEWAVLQEFANSGPRLGYDVRLMSAVEVKECCEAVRPEGLRGGLYSGMELGVDPKSAAARLSAWLAETRGVRLAFGTEVVEVREGPVVVPRGHDPLDFDLVIVCTGRFWRQLFPRAFAEAGLVNCKLQMLSTAPQPAGWRMGPHLASGLTLRHYPAFRVCNALPALEERIRAEAPELDAAGIHVMASQPADGRVILGDSHVYGEEPSPFDSASVERLILRELGRIIQLPDWTIEARWHGVYAKTPGGYCCREEVLPGVWVSTGAGGSGMTMAFGIAEEFFATVIADEAAGHREGSSPALVQPRGDDDPIEAIVQLFARHGESLYGGEAVTQIEHALQAASLAVSAGADDAQVTAALLHDVGHLLHTLPDDAPEQGVDDRHEELAARRLSAWFGADVCEPIRLHVDAKRYLTATEPSYLAGLSAASLTSLALQGGPMDMTEQESFRRHSRWREAVELRRWDDQAKVPGLETPDIGFYLATVRACLLTSGSTFRSGG